MDFQQAVKRFNQMYGLPAPNVPTMYSDPVAKQNALGRLQQFKQILQDELNEVEDIIALVAAGQHDQLDVFVPLADWLGDIQVYCASEMLRWGLPNDLVLECIMRAQDSKLGADGLPIVKDGKVQKGPNYAPPEPRIRAVLEAILRAGYAQNIDYTGGPTDA